MGRGAHLAVWLATVSAAVTACGNPEPRFVSLDGLDFDQVFIVELDEADQPGAILGALRPHEDHRAPLELASRAEQIVFVGFDDRDLEPHYRGAAASILASLDGPEGRCAEPALPGLVDDEGARLRRGLPPEARLFTHELATGAAGPSAEATEQRIRESLALDVPIDAEGCSGRSPSQRVLRPFANTPMPLAPGATLLGQPISEQDLRYTDVAGAGEGRALVTSPRFLLLFERGRAFEDRAEHAIALPGARQLTTVLVDPDPARGEGARRVFVGGLITRGSSYAGRIWELRLDALGLRYVGTATDTANGIRDLHLDADTGRIVAATESGFILIQDTPAAVWRAIRVQADPLGEMNPSFVTRTGWDDRPFVTGGATDLALYLSNRDLSEWTPVADGLDGTRTYRAFGAVSTSEGPELWTVSSAGNLFRLEETRTTWSRLTVAMPPSYGCGAGFSCGWRQHQNRGTALSSIKRGDHSWVYVIGTDCFAVAEIRDDRVCASHLTVPDPVDPNRPFQVPLGTDQLGQSKPRPLVGGQISDGWLMVASELGGVYASWVGEGDPPD